MIPKTVTVNLDKDRVFFYNMKVAMMFEDTMGKPSKQFDVTSPRDICTMAQVMFAKEDKEITVDQVSELITGENLIEVQQALADVMGMKLIRTQQTADGKPVEAKEDVAKN